MFDDLFSSSKGPGVIGLLLGVFVLAGFCGLGFAVFDGRLNGDFANRQNREHSQNDQKIANLKSRLASYEETAKEYKDLKKVAAKAQEANDRLTQRREQKIETETKIAETEGEVAAVRQQWDDYKEEYRAFARQRIKGRLLERLVTEEGDIYEGVKVTEATPLELGIMTTEGPKRVKLAVCPKEIRDELQYDEEQARAMAVAIDAVEGDRGELARIEAQIIRLKRAIRDYEAKISKHDDAITTGPARKQANEVAAQRADRDADEYMRAFHLDRRDGREGVSRNDDRAEAERRKAAALRQQNALITRDVARAATEKREFEGEVKKLNKQIEELEAERRAIIEESRNPPEPEAG